MAKVKAHVLTVVYCEDGAGEPCLVVADLENGKKDILNIVHGIHATGIFKMLTTFQHVFYARGNGKTMRSIKTLQCLEKLFEGGIGNGHHHL